MQKQTLNTDYYHLCFDFGFILLSVHHCI